MIIDIKYFLVILIVIICGFGSAFYSLSNDNVANEDRFIADYIFGLIYAYKIALGDFDTGKFGSSNVWIVWILFLLSTVIVLVVMLNLLIAIVGDTFERVLGYTQNAQYMEIVQLMQDNLHLIPQSSKDKFN